MFSASGIGTIFLVGIALAILLVVTTGALISWDRARRLRLKTVFTLPVHRPRTDRKPASVFLQRQL
jgi:hypothetical protein